MRQILLTIIQIRFQNMICQMLFFVPFVSFVVKKRGIPRILKAIWYKQANKKFCVLKKPDFSEKSGFSENFMTENLWNLT